MAICLVAEVYSAVTDDEAVQSRLQSLSHFVSTPIWGKYLNLAQFHPHKGKDISVLTQTKKNPYVSKKCRRVMISNAQRAIIEFRKQIGLYIDRVNSTQTGLVTRELASEVEQFTINPGKHIQMPVTQQTSYFRTYKQDAVKVYECHSLYCSVRKRQ